MAKSERELALYALNKTVYDGGFSNRIIDDTCKGIEDSRKRAFFTKLYLSTLENLILLDTVIEYMTNKKTKNIERPVLGILRITLGQVFFMDSVPDHAALSEAQKLCEKLKLHRAKGFVNGVLRNVLRKKDSVIEESLAKYSEKEREARRHSLPLWLYEYLCETVGEKQIKSLLNNFSGEHFLSVRILKSKITMEEAFLKYKEIGLEPEIIEDLPVIRFRRSVPTLVIPGVLEGYAYVQDISSVKAVSALDLKAGEKVLDMCSAPGGKGLFASELVGKDGVVILRDVSDSKTDIIRENAGKFGIGNTTIEVWDALKPDESLFSSMDAVIADVPCSGLGTIGNKCEIKYRINKEDIKILSDIQGKILEVAKEYVKPGGRLLFSTCTISKLENEENTDRFLKNNPNFKKIKEELIFPDGRGSDGFFYTVLKKDK